jgi:hypothetical protein
MGRLAAWNRTRAAWIVKRRERLNWTTQTIKGPRRVKRWSRWEANLYCGSLYSAIKHLSELRSRPGAGFSDYAIFRYGKRLSEEQIKKGV